MPYPTKMVSALTGVSAHQLRRLRCKGVIAPSRGRDGEYLYSFDDLWYCVFLRNYAHIFQLKK
ncbi:MerR family transcriptional regulator [Bifidobacterium ramosum]|uniref:MerR family transcriptional regulator n=1 Tax=Bifidobacterium ramosum TaxID=1798158 RepID=A0A7K3TBW6_9BIFI|nr:MerR family transcriptional regulator [Bifidobacterium ramosum]